jgi:hypothetical protein
MTTETEVGIVVKRLHSYGVDYETSHAVASSVFSGPTERTCGQ